MSLVGLWQPILTVTVKGCKGPDPTVASQVPDPTMTLSETHKMWAQESLSFQLPPLNLASPTSSSKQNAHILIPPLLV